MVVGDSICIQFHSGFIPALAFARHQVRGGAFLVHEVEHGVGQVLAAEIAKVDRPSRAATSPDLDSSPLLPLVGRILLFLLVCLGIGEVVI